MSHATLKFVRFKYATFGIKTNVAFTSEYLIHSYKRYFSLDSYQNVLKKYTVTDVCSQSRDCTKAEIIKLKV